VERLLVFTDLDGTLLDADTYSWGAARPALTVLLDSGAYLVPATSKTRAEVRPLQRALGSSSAAIVENGSEIFGEEDVLRPIGAIECSDGGWEWASGPDHAEVLAALDDIGRQLGLGIRPFSRMSEQEAGEVTGLSRTDLAAARDRRHSEPFLASGADIDVLQAAAGPLGFEVTSGGRFFSLGGVQDKGAGVNRIVSACGAKGYTVVTAGLGDSLNDASLLRAVDYPILIPKPDGAHDPSVLGASVRLCLADRPGPAGWSAAVLTLLDCWRSGGLDPHDARSPDSSCHDERRTSA
jgi:mannosyl-3-phosphoglycerate phosphatase